MITRILLFLLGFWLLRMLWKSIAGLLKATPRRDDSGETVRPGRRPESASFESGEIVDAEFEEVDESGRKS